MRRKQCWKATAEIQRVWYLAQTSDRDIGSANRRCIVATTAAPSGMCSDRAMGDELASPDSARYVGGSCRARNWGAEDSDRRFVGLLILASASGRQTTSWSSAGDRRQGFILSVEYHTWTQSASCDFSASTKYTGSVRICLSTTTFRDTLRIRRGRPSGPGQAPCYAWHCWVAYSFLRTSFNRIRP